MAIKHDTPLPTEPIAVRTETPGDVRFTYAMLEFLEKSGLLEGRYELINGRIISKMGQNSPHSMTVTECFAYLVGLFPRRTVRSQTTMHIWVDNMIQNSLEPDMMVLRRVVSKGAPSSTDVQLVLEVSDTTLKDDFVDKVEMYARAGIAEYWAIHLPHRTLTAFREPDAATGTWARRETLSETQTVAPQSAPDALIRVSELLPPTD